VGVSLLSSFLLLRSTQCLVFSTGPADYDFSGTRAISTLEDSNESNILGDCTPDRVSDTESQKETKGTSEKESSLKQPVSDTKEVGLDNDEETRVRSLKMVFRKALIYSSILTLIVVILGQYGSTILFAIYLIEKQSRCPCSFLTISSVRSSIPSGQPARCKCPMSTLGSMEYSPTFFR
jgi:hypothetical protein